MKGGRDEGSVANHPPFISLNDVVHYQTKHRHNQLQAGRIILLMDSEVSVYRGRECMVNYSCSCPGRQKAEWDGSRERPRQALDPKGMP